MWITTLSKWWALLAITKQIWNPNSPSSVRSSFVHFSYQLVQWSFTINNSGTMPVFIFRRCWIDVTMESEELYFAYTPLWISQVDFSFCFFSSLTVQSASCWSEWNVRCFCPFQIASVVDLQIRSFTVTNERFRFTFNYELRLFTSARFYLDDSD